MEEKSIFHNQIHPIIITRFNIRIYNRNTHFLEKMRKKGRNLKSRPFLLGKYEQSYIRFSNSVGLIAATLLIVKSLMFLVIM